MPFTITPRVVKSAHAAHAIAEGAEDFEDNDGDSQMATGADKPMRSDDEAAKGVRNHPDTGRFMGSGETAYGASSPLHTALAQHRAPAPLGSFQSAVEPARGGSLIPEQVSVAHLDYRAGSGPVATAIAPIQRPAPHTAPNGVRP